MSNSSIYWLVETSARVSMVIGVLMCARPWLRRWIGNRAVAFLWLVIAARLLLPWPIESSWGLAIGPAEKAEPRQVIHVSVTSGGGDTRPAQHPQASQAAAGRSVDWDGWMLLWASGAGLTAANVGRSWWQARRWARGTAPVVESPRLSRIFNAIPDAWRRGVELRIIDGAHAPALHGVRRPQIWMPRAWAERLSDTELRHVLLHEIGHARRGDLLAQWMFSLTCCVHWFNPLVWMMARLARADREVACDAWVLAREGEESCTEYGSTLIRIVEEMRGGRAWDYAPAAVAMAAGRRNLALRVREIGAFQPVARWRGVAALAAAGALVAAFTVSRAADSAAPSVIPKVLAEAAGGSTAAQDEIEIEGKMLSLSKSAMLQLKLEEGRSSGSKELFDQLIKMSGEATDAKAPGTALSISQFIPEDEYESLLRRLDKLKGVDFLSAPRVTTKAGQKAVIQSAMEDYYPTAFERVDKPGKGTILTPTKFDEKDAGLTLTVLGTVAPARDAIDLTVSWQMVDIQGYVRIKDGKPLAFGEKIDGDCRPVFSTQSLDTCVTIPPGATLVLGDLRRDPVQLSFLTVRLVDRRGNVEKH